MDEHPLFPPHPSIWIASEHKNQWVAFKKDFFLSCPPPDIFAQVAVDTKYWLSVNGIPVVNDGGLLRDSYPSCGYYDEVNLTGHLKKGANEIFALVWYWGNEGRNNTDGGEPGFSFRCPGLGIYSDTSWKAAKHPSFYETSHPFPSYLYGGYNIGYDASAELPIHWEEPVEKECRSWNILIKRPVPLFLFSDIRESTPEVISSGETIVSLPHAMHVSPWFRVDAPSSCTIHVRTDRYEVNGGPGDQHHSYRSHRLEYKTREGIQEFVSPYWLFGEKIIYDFPPDVKVLATGYRESGYDTSFEGTFHTGDSLVDRLFEKCRRTLYVCMRENFMDCPDRERGQWIGDVSSQVPQVFYALDEKARLLCQKAILDFIRLRKGQVLVGNVPGAHSSELPSQSLNAISDIGMVMTYYRHSGDTEILRKAYPAVHDYLMLFSMEESGLVAHRPGNWNWFDHLDGIDETVLENCWYHLALAGAMEMAEAIGFLEHLEEYKRRRASIRLGIQAFKKQGGYASLDFYDDRANAMVLLSGLCESDMVAPCMNVLRTIHRCTPYMEYYVLAAMFEAGFPQAAFTRMMERYRFLIENENSTLWEDFHILGTRNHAWSGGPLTLMFRYILGISPASPGYGKAYFRPVFVGLPRVRGHVRTIRGTLSSDIAYGIGQMTMDVSFPDGVTAICGIPEGYFHSPFTVTADGKPVVTESVDGFSTFILEKSGRIKALAI
ncbi:MAG: alpha-L-rhamnosidase C-terminal domain-containing protein [Clostridia bacterium]